MPLTNKVNEHVCLDIMERAQHGAVKYGTTVDRTDLNEVEWLQHAYEESMDLCVYLKRVLMEKRGEM